MEEKQPYYLIDKIKTDLRFRFINRLLIMFEECVIFLRETLFSMMLLLIQNIFTDPVNIPFGYGKSRTRLLPLKQSYAQFIGIDELFRTVGYNSCQCFFIHARHARNK